MFYVWNNVCVDPVKQIIHSVSVLINIKCIANKIYFNFTVLSSILCKHPWLFQSVHKFTDLSMTSNKAFPFFQVFQPEWEPCIMMSHKHLRNSKFATSQLDNNLSPKGIPGSIIDRNDVAVRLNFKKSLSVILFKGVAAWRGCLSDTPSGKQPHHPTATAAEGSASYFKLHFGSWICSKQWVSTNPPH